MSRLEWLLVAATLAAFAFGYWVIRQAGKLLDREHPQPVEAEIRQTEILVYGNSEYEAAAEHALNSHSLNFCRATNVRELLDLRGCRYLLALSDKESENLIACELGEQVTGIPIRIALCRPGSFEPEFENRDVRHFSPDLFQPDQLASLLDKRSRGNPA